MRRSERKSKGGGGGGGGWVFICLDVTREYKLEFKSRELLTRIYLSGFFFIFSFDYENGQPKF